MASRCGQFWKRCFCGGVVLGWFCGWCLGSAVGNFILGDGSTQRQPAGQHAPKPAGGRAETATRPGGVPAAAPTRAAHVPTKRGLGRARRDHHGGGLRRMGRKSNDRHRPWPDADAMVRRSHSPAVGIKLSPQSSWGGYGVAMAHAPEGSRAED